MSSFRTPASPPLENTSIPLPLVWKLSEASYVNVQCTMCGNHKVPVPAVYLDMLGKQWCNRYDQTDTCRTLTQRSWYWYIRMTGMVALLSVLVEIMVAIYPVNLPAGLPQIALCLLSSPLQMDPPTPHGMTRVQFPGAETRLPLGLSVLFLLCTYFYCKTPLCTSVVIYVAINIQLLTECGCCAASRREECGGDESRCEEHEKMN